MLPCWVADYIGLPWKPLGRDRNGLDCYGLVRLVLAEQFGLLLPAFSADGWAADLSPQALDGLAGRIAINLRDDWRPVPFADRRPGDLALLLMQGRPVHLGLVVAAPLFLHIREGSSSGLDRFDSLAWRTRLLGIHRHRALG
ncbi:MAG: NlpC/P60 family protein [Burkholderiaceae bacterium]|nr:NlpC/P60 family protein [Burkholderiaceae bacterium]